jgi:hypothetical protein
MSSSLWPSLLIIIVGRMPSNGIPSESPIASPSRHPSNFDGSAFNSVFVPLWLIFF